MDKSLRIQVLMAAVDKVTAPLRSVLKGARGLSTGLKETQRELQRLNAAQKDLGRFRELKAGTAATARELDQARARAGDLARQLGATATPTRKMTAEFRRAREAVNALEQRQQAEGRELQQIRQRMEAAGRGTKSLAQHERDLRQSIVQTSAALDKQKTKLAAVARQQERLEKARAAFDRRQDMAGNIAQAGAGAVAGAAAILVPLAAADKAAGDYESSLTDVAQKANLTRAQARGLGADLVRVGRVTNQLPEDIVASVDAVAGLGAELDQARRMVGPMAKAATAYKASMDDLGRASFAVVDNLKAPVEQTGKVLDVMAEAGKRGAFELADMAQYFPALTAAAAGLGQTGVPAVADLAAALQITRKGAGDSADAATNLNNLLQKIAAPTTVKNFKKFGVDLVRELNAAAKRGETPIEAIAELTNKALKGDMSRLAYLFEDAQVQRALRPLIAHLDEYRAIRQGALSAEGVVDADFAERLKDQNQRIQQLKVGVVSLGLTLGAQLAPTVMAVADRVAGAVDKVNAWAERNPVLAGTLAKIAGAAAILLGLVGGLALAVAAILGPLALANLAWVQALPALTLLGKGFLFVGEAALAMGEFLLANPILLAVAALAVGAVLLIRHWSQVSAFFKALGPKFREFGANLISGLVAGITGRLAELRSAVTGVAGKAAAWFKERLGIHSPSRVFAELGGYTMAGLAQGLRGGEREPLNQVRATAAGLVAAMAVTGAAAPALAAPGGSAGAAAGQAAQAAARAGGNTYTIHIHPAPGDDPQAIARAVAAELDRRERAAGAQRRSALGDLDRN